MDELFDKAKESRSTVGQANGRIYLKGVFFIGDKPEVSGMKVLIKKDSVLENGKVNSTTPREVGKAVTGKIFVPLKGPMVEAERLPPKEVATLLTVGNV